MEDKKQPPPLGMPLYKGVPEDLVEVEVNSEFFFLVEGY